MSEKRFVTTTGNEATSMIAHLCNEVCAIYPITPSSDMGEFTDQWAAAGKKNIYGTVPDVVEMQSEAGAAAAVHGSLQGGAVTSTFTASQGLLLMIPTMFKVAGELTSTVFHVSARSVATHALSIFGDHSDVMACRTTGWGLLACGSVQETHDLALVAYAATFESRIPIVHFFDGFRTSHEVSKIEQLVDEDAAKMIDMSLIQAHRDRAMNPDAPKLRGTSQNPDVFFQAREAPNKYYDAAPAIVQKAMDRFGELFGRKYNLFDYVGADDAELVVVVMTSGQGVVEEAVDRLVSEGQKVGLVKVRLYRPFCVESFINALPKTVKKIAVLDRTKEPGSTGEPLYLDVVAALTQAWKGTMPVVTSGRYGLSSKEFTPAMAKGVFDELAKGNAKPKFTVGINDDVTNLSIDYDPEWSTESDDITRAVFFGLGSDGTVGANKNSVKIIGEHTDLYAQGYFVYDSKKAGSVTVSHLRFSPRPLKGSYLVSKANFVACHQEVFVEKLDMLKIAAPGATLLLNSPLPKDQVWDSMPKEMQQDIIDKKMKVYAIDAYEVARKAEMGVRINTVMQTCFFKLAGTLPEDEAIASIKTAIEKTYGAKGGEKIVKRNFAAVDGAIDALYELEVPASVTSKETRHAGAQGNPPEFVKNVLGKIIANCGDELPVSAMPADGTFPTATTQYEKRGIAQDIPIWDSSLCIQCGLCSLACPHAAIRMKAIDADQLKGAPETFTVMDWKGKEYPEMKTRIQVAPDDCVGCGLCVNTCPAKSKTEEGHKAINMCSKHDHLETERANFEFFMSLPDMDRANVKKETLKGSQLLLPLFEFSGACAGCGETPYVKLVTQFFGDRMVVANATGCSSIYGGNLPTTPYAVNADGKGPAWNNSLFEDAAEFGLGFRLAIDQAKEYAILLLKKLSGELGDGLVNGLIENQGLDEAEVAEQRKMVAEVKSKLAKSSDPDAKNLIAVADYLIRRSVWSFGGDGWAYDIGYGGLDHTLASGRDINLLVMDTEVYSNTGGQASKATPRGAVAKFAASGRPARKKDLGLMAMAYGNVFVGQISLGANPVHAVKTILAAESYRGPSIVIAYAHCIAHGIEMVKGFEIQKEAVATGFWPLYHYDPRDGAEPFHLDSKEPKGDYKDFISKQARFTQLTRTKPEEAERLAKLAQQDIADRFTFYSGLAGIKWQDED
ncbi:MAG: pyruvate:ferredoxin (flavodoxin) oxidoreductase [Planctomycetia bacterium]